MPLKLVKRHGGDIWYVRGTLQGRPVDRSTGLRNKAQAETIKSAIEREIIESRIAGRREERMSYPAASLAYLKTRPDSAARFHDRLIAHFSDYFVDEVTQGAIDRAAILLYPNGKPATINRQLIAPVSAVLKFSAKREWCPARSIERRREPASNPHILTDAERDRFIAACTPAFRNLMTFLWLTGARTGEALWLDWRNVDLSRAEVTFRNTKNGESRTVPLHLALIPMLASLPHRTDEVFRKANGMPYERPAPDQDEDTSAGSRIKTAFKGACRRAGIKDFHPHDIRHNWATAHYRVNRDLLLLQRHGGWKSQRMVTRYAQLSNPDGQDAIDRLTWGKSGETKNDKSKKQRITNR